MKHPDPSTVLVQLRHLCSVIAIGLPWQHSQPPTVLTHTSPVSAHNCASETRYLNLQPFLPLLASSLSSQPGGSFCNTPSSHFVEEGNKSACMLTFSKLVCSAYVPTHNVKPPGHAAKYALPPQFPLDLQILLRTWFGCPNSTLAQPICPPKIPGFSIPAPALAIWNPPWQCQQPLLFSPNCRYLSQRSPSGSNVTSLFSAHLPRLSYCATSASSRRRLVFEREPM